MYCTRAEARAPHTGADLHEAPRIPGRDELDASGRDVTQLGREHRVRRVGLDEIVNPGGATTVFRAFQGRELERRNGTENCERWIDDALCVEKVTWRVVCDRPPYFSTTNGTSGNEQLTDVAHLGRKSCSSLGISGVIREQVRVFLHHRATASRIGAHVLRPAPLEGVDVCAGEVKRAPHVARVRMQRSAATLTRGVDHCVAIHYQHALSGSIRLVEQTFHDTAEEECDTTPVIVAASRVRASMPSIGRSEHRHRETKSAR